MNSPLWTRLFRYNDWANTQLLDAAQHLSADRLDRPFEMGVGSLRRSLIHIYNGEHVWLERWKQRPALWPSESDPTPVAELRTRFAANARERDAFLAALSGDAAEREQVYRDSKGSLFRAPLVDMILQGYNHSTHHRAQAVNMLRQLGAGVVELDYMMSLRQPAPETAT
ncbi:MAG: DinB family protein [Phycisphaerae bacterium]